MRTASFLAPSALAAILAFAPVAGRAAIEGPPAGTWIIEPSHSFVGFTATKAGFANVPGRFTDFAGEIRYDPAHPGQSSVRWRVRVASIQTDARGRDQTVQTTPYFDAARFPELTFESRRVEPLPSGRLSVTGDLTIKGHTRRMTMVVSPVEGGFETRFEIDRHDFGITGEGLFRRLIGRKVDVHLIARRTR